MAREVADGAIPTPAACGAAVRIKLTAARLQGGLRVLKVKTRTPHSYPYP